MRSAGFTGIAVVTSPYVPRENTRSLAQEHAWGFDGLAWLHGPQYAALEVVAPAWGYLFGDQLLIHPDNFDALMKTLR